MLFLDAKEKAKRLEICKGCKYYRTDTKSCGPLLLGRTLEDAEWLKEGGEIKQRNAKVKLCGCFMPVKTKFALAKCPLDKWGAIRLTDEEVEQLRTELEKIKRMPTFTTNDLGPMYALYSKLTGQHHRPSTCASCVKQVIEGLERELNHKA